MSDQNEAKGETETEVAAVQEQENIINVAACAEYDLTSTLAPYMDLHFMIPLIQYLQTKDLYKSKDLLKTILDLLGPTNMIDFTVEIQNTLNGTEGEETEEDAQRRQAVEDNLENLKNDCEPLLNLLADEEATNQLTADGNFIMEYLEENHGITENMLDAFYRYGKFHYDCGNYDDVIFYMYYYRMLDEESPQAVSALWGKLAAEILVMKWDDALADIMLLKKTIDAREENEGRGVNHLELLQLRSWLLHWSLFVFFNHPNGKSEIIDFFSDVKYMNAIQTNCPWLLRYLTTAAITNINRRQYLKQLVTIIKQENYTYSDPITEFVECLYVNFNFEKAQEKLEECEKVLAGDFFLVYSHKEFMENARTFIFDVYCRIHTKIDIGMLSTKLHMNQVEAEKWIVDLIRNAKLDAKIDSEKNYVIMGQQHPEVYQKIIDKTKNLSFRTYNLVNNVMLN